MENCTNHKTHNEALPGANSDMFLEKQPLQSQELPLQAEGTHSPHHLRGGLSTNTESCAGPSLRKSFPPITTAQEPAHLPGKPALGDGGWEWYAAGMDLLF